MQAVQRAFELGDVPRQRVDSVICEAGLPSDVMTIESRTSPHIEDAQAQIEVVLGRRAVFPCRGIVLECALVRPRLERQLREREVGQLLSALVPERHFMRTRMDSLIRLLIYPLSSTSNLVDSFRSCSSAVSYQPGTACEPTSAEISTKRGVGALGSERPLRYRSSTSRVVKCRAYESRSRVWEVMISTASDEACLRIWRRARGGVVELGRRRRRPMYVRRVRSARPGVSP